MIHEQSDIESLYSDISSSYIPALIRVRAVFGYKPVFFFLLH